MAVGVEMVKEVVAKGGGGVEGVEVVEVVEMVREVAGVAVAGVEVAAGATTRAAAKVG